MKKSKVTKKRRKKLVISVFYLNYHFFSKESRNSKDLTIKQLSEALPFHPPKRKKRAKRLTKYQILSNVLPFFHDVQISRIEHALRGYAETYNIISYGF